MRRGHGRQATGRSRARTRRRGADGRSAGAPFSRARPRARAPSRSASARSRRARRGSPTRSPPRTPAGSHPDEWDSWEEDTIEGFATQISVNAGETVHFKVSTDAPAYTIRIFRMGWYQGLGARQVAEVSPSVTLPQVQPPPLTDPATGARRLRQLGGVGLVGRPRRRLRGSTSPASSASTTVTATASSSWSATTAGTRTSCCRRRTRRCTPTTAGAATACTSGTRSAGRSRSATTDPSARSTATGNSFFDSEYPLVRWLERNGYDVSYTTDVDSDRRPQELLIHKLFVSSGHDEYWSSAQRANVEAARDAGVNLAFFGRRTRCSGRPGGSRASTLRPRRAERSSVTRRPWRRPSSTPRPSGRAPGAIPGSARRPTAATPRRPSWGSCSGRSTTSPRPTRPSGARSVRRHAVLARHRRGHRRARHDGGPHATAASGTSGTTTATSASSPPGLVELSSTTRRRPPGAPRPRPHLRHRPGHAPAHALPRPERSPRLRRRYLPVGLGARRPPPSARGRPRPRPRPGRMAHHRCASSRRPPTCSPIWAASRARSRRAWSSPFRRPTSIPRCR